MAEIAPAAQNGNPTRAGCAPRARRHPQQRVKPGAGEAPEADRHHNFPAQPEADAGRLRNGPERMLAVALAPVVRGRRNFLPVALEIALSKSAPRNVLRLAMPRPDEHRGVGTGRDRI